jgi:hypothetical protein
MKTLLASLLTLAAVTAGAPQPAAVDYQFDEVRRKVTLVATDQVGQPVTKGQRAKSGDEVETGWFSYALIASPGYRAKFEIFSGTNVRLADGTAGVILSVERGRIRAAFDKIVGSEPRVVKTPGALLAVRGTKFDVEVDAKGNTTVDVFEGLVELRSSMLREPMFVRPGQQSTYDRRGERPSVHEMPEERRQRGPEGSRDNHDRQRTPGADDHSRHDPPSPPGGDHRPPQPPPPPPSDHKPPV